MGERIKQGETLQQDEIEELKMLRQIREQLKDLEAAKPKQKGTWGLGWFQRGNNDKDTKQQEQEQGVGVSVGSRSHNCNRKSVTFSDNRMLVQVHHVINLKKGLSEKQRNSIWYTPVELYRMQCEYNYERKGQHLHNHNRRAQRRRHSAKPLYKTRNVSPSTTPLCASASAAAAALATLTKKRSEATFS